jgi:YidC/Oxa1 family membrane protein insertase
MSSLSHDIGSIFQPLLKAVADFLAILYSFIPVYPIDVALLTIAIMAVLTPLTVKSTKNMAAMQALGPEMKKLQQKYKGAENRAVLNEEMMKLYKEHKVNPASGCLPMLLQMPAFLILYDVIRGITNTVTIPAKSSIVGGLKTFVPAHVVAEPRYIGHTTKMYTAITHAKPPGSLNAFGMDFAQKLFSHHSSILVAAPYLLLVVASVGLQYLQMSRLNARNPGANQANPQAAMLQKYMPLIFGLIYLNIAAIINVYFVFSSAIRIGTQEVLFRRGIVAGPPPATAAGSKAIPPKGPSGRAPSGSKSDRSEREIARARPPSTSKPSAGTTRRSGSGGTGRPAPKSTPANARANGANGRAKPAPGGNGSGPTAAKPNASRGTGSNGSGATRNPKPGSAPRSTRNNPSRAATTPPEEGTAPKEHPRSKAKRERKAR